MAGTTITIRQEFMDGTQVERQRLAINAIIDDLELIRARHVALAGKLDNDAGVTDTNYTAGTYGGTSAISSAAVLTGYKINTYDG